MQFGSFGTGPGQFSGLGQDYLAIDSLGNIYVVDSNSKRVEKFDPQGNFLFEFGSDIFSLTPTGIAIDNNDNIYIGDSHGMSGSGTAYIKIFTTSGKYISQLDLSPAGNLNITWLGIDKNHNIYASDFLTPKNQEFDQYGKFIRIISSFPDGHADGFAIDSKGNYYISDEGRGGGGYNYIQILDHDGNLIYIINGPSGAYDTAPGRFWNPGPYGIAIDDSDYLYAADINNNRVQVFDPNHNYVTQIGVTGSGTFKPYDVKVDRHGYIYVMDSGNYRIQVFHWRKK
jgi:DNA-binding beta-propeller fold protein YncE